MDYFCYYYSYSIYTTYFQRLNKIIKVIAMIKRNCLSISQLDGNEPAIPVVELNIECINTKADTIVELNFYIIISYSLPNNLISNLHGWWPSTFYLYF